MLKKHGLQDLRPHRLAEVIVHATFDTLFTVASDSRRCESDDLDIRDDWVGIGSDTASRFVAIESMHLPIHEHDIKRASMKSSDCLKTVRR